jgi:hypothetical protein
MRTAKGLRNKWGFRIGAEWMQLTGTDTLTNDKVKVSFAAIPFNINYRFGRRKDFLELGIGATYVYARADGKHITHEVSGIQVWNQDLLGLYGNFNIGYRHMPYKKGLTYGIAVTPVFGGGLLEFWMGFGIGYHL